VASYMDETGYLDTYGGISLHERSHGEAFMATLTIKLRGNGFYILMSRKPALLRPGRWQLYTQFTSLLRKNRSFIIATHSPILLAYPGARILLLNESGITDIAYEETENYSVSRRFLNNHDDIVRHLLEEQ